MKEITGSFSLAVEGERKPGETLSITATFHPSNEGFEDLECDLMIASSSFAKSLVTASIWLRDGKLSEVKTDAVLAGGKLDPIQIHLIIFHKGRHSGYQEFIL